MKQKLNKLTKLLCVFALLFVSFEYRTQTIHADTITLTYGYSTDYTPWSTEQTGDPTEQSKTFYRYRTVSTWSSCDSSHTSKPSNGIYKQGSYTTTCKNCGTSCSYGTNCEHGCRACYGDRVCGITGPSNGCAWGSHYWSCDNGCDGWSSGGGCTLSCWNYDTTSSKTCYATPTEWGSWSSWSATAVSGTTSKQVESKTFYSHLDKFNITYQLNGGVETTPNPRTYKVTDDDIYLSEPVKDGYDFVGWQPEGYIPSGSRGDKTFEAIWQPTEYSYTGTTFKKGDGASDNSLVPNAYYSDDYSYKYKPVVTNKIEACAE